MRHRMPTRHVTATNGHAGGPTPPRTEIVLADRDPLVRRVVRETLVATGEFAIVAETEDMAEAVQLVVRHRPDIAVLESRPPGEVIAAVRQIAELMPSLPVVAFAGSPDQELDLEALRSGASGVIYKNQGMDGMVHGLRAVARGELAVPRTLTVHLIGRMRSLSSGSRGMRPVDSPLTDREWEVVDLLRTGATPTDIADDLFLERETVYRHLKNIRRKLGVRSCADAVSAAEDVVRASLGLP
jgi:DNA-binding NarL/FixJ family response regulator